MTVSREEYENNHKKQRYKEEHKMTIKKNTKTMIKKNAKTFDWLKIHH